MSVTSSITGVDLFSGAGGMSLGAEMAGITVEFAVECDTNAVATYRRNNPNIDLHIGDIRGLKNIPVDKAGRETILFGGPPCQGFSTSNQRTRGEDNDANWLFMEFLRLTDSWEPDWVVFENVRGIAETAKGIFKRKIQNGLTELGYTCSSWTLSASDYGVPQRRSRFFVIGSIAGHLLDPPKQTSSRPVTVKQAIGDLPELGNGANTDVMPYRRMATNRFAKSMRNGRKACSNHLVSVSGDCILKRYSHVPQGGNWEDIPEELMGNYADRSRCHTGIYRRLIENEPSIVIGNYRKNMLIHPWADRGLSVREAARLQSFPDWYEFAGSIGFQQQQVGNAVPPLLAKSVFLQVVNAASAM